MRFVQSRGISVIGQVGHFVRHRFPSLIDLDGLTQGVDYFLGGYLYNISDAVALQLIADGFGAYVDQYGDLYLDAYA